LKAQLKLASAKTINLSIYENWVSPYDYFYASFVLILCLSPDSQIKISESFSHSTLQPTRILTILQRSLQWDDNNSHGRFVLFCCERQDSGFTNVPLMRLEYFLSQKTTHCL
jgi:hypothetical protein